MTTTFFSILFLSFNWKCENFGISKKNNQTQINSNWFIDQTRFQLFFPSVLFRFSLDNHMINI